MIVCNLPVLGPIFGIFRDQLVSLSRRSGTTWWIDITNERSNDKGGYQLSDISRMENGAPGEIMSSSSQHKYVWQEGSGTVTSASFSGGREVLDHKSGILACTEIFTTVEEGNPRAV